MKKQGQQREVGVVGAVVFFLAFIFVGFMLLSSTEQQATPEASNLLNPISWTFIVGGIIGILMLIVVGILWLIKEFG
jgi:predicted tellurium resistance membrane protein TerC